MRLLPPLAPSDTAQLAQIDIALGWSSGTNSFILNLRKDGNGPTGPILETCSFSAPNFIGPDLNTLTPVQPAILNAGTLYWLEVLPGGADTWGGWNHPFGDSSPAWLSTSLDRGATWSPPVYALGAPAVDVVSTPEPGSVLLTFIGWAGLAVRRRQR